MNIAFLFEPYKPGFWYSEAIETIRMLIMTGVLSIIRPGTFTQLSWGMSLSVFFSMLLQGLQPYSERRYNWIAVLSSTLLFLVFLSASFIKYNQLLAEESQTYDLIWMDILLIVAYGSVIVLFL